MKTSENPLVFLAAALGAGLVFAAVRNISPIEFFRLTLQGGDTSGVKPIAERINVAELAATGTEDTSGSLDRTNSGSADAFPLDPTDLAGIVNNPGHKLIPRAAVAFESWTRAYGAPIIVTDSYRSVAVQADARRKAEARGEHGRFAKVSLHSRGIAVDVNLPATTNGQSRAGQPEYDKLMAAGRLTGWVTYSDGDPAKGHTHHFSHGARG